ncbi:MAG: hypothetical protein ABI550_01110 [Ignavibacteriaceae bacterium]
MKTPNEMTTLSEAMNKMRDKGFDQDFEMTTQGFINAKSRMKYQPNNLIIKKIFRFEGDSNPDDMAILYAIEAADGIKGLLVDAFGTYADDGSDYKLAEFLQKVKVEETN